MRQEGMEAVRQALVEARSVFMVPHVGIDGDDLGCMVALHSVLEGMGKEAFAFCPEPVPHGFRSMPGLGRLSRHLPERTFDLAVVLECPQASRLPPGLDLARMADRVANVDHHRGNEGYGDILWVDPEAAALGEMVFDLVEALGAGLDATSAVGLYVAIFSDTGSFQYPRVRPGTHRRVARLLEHGVPTDVLGRQILREEPFEALRLLGRVLSRLVVEENGRVAWTEIHGRELAEAGLKGEDVRHFVERVDQVRGTEVVAMFTELGPSRIKVSLRSRGPAVNRVAACFGGGGHDLAAGCLLEVPLPEARRLVLEELARTLRSAASS